MPPMTPSKGAKKAVKPAKGAKGEGKRNVDERRHMLFISTKC